MTFTTHARARKLHRRRAGFTLVELLVAMSISTMIVAGVMTTFLSLSRTSLRLGSYNDMESETRKGLELFGRDARMANTIVWNSATDISLTIPATGPDETYRYAYNSTARTFTRTETAPVASTPQTLFTNVDSLDFKAYKINTAAVDLSNLAQAAIDTKQIQLTVNSSRTNSTVAAATANVLSARFILRNKKVTN